MTKDNTGLQKDLRKLFEKAKMPSSPALAARILELSDDLNSTAEDFGKILRTDAILTARLLKTANSAFFAQRIPVTNVERAVTVLGLNRVKTTALGFQLVSHLDRLGGTPFDMNLFWTHSLLRACIAQSLAGFIVPEFVDEAFIVGLLQDTGIMLLSQILGEGYANLYRPEDLSPTAFFEVESKTFPHTHVDAISVMCAEWKLPHDIAIPLRRHHQETRITDQSSILDKLCGVSYLVGGLRFASDVTIGTEENKLREYANVQLHLHENMWNESINWAIEEYKRISTFFGEVLENDIDVVDLLGEANQQLTAVADEANQKVVDIELEKEKILKDQKRLEKSLKDYRERASLDPLTLIPNRGAIFDAATIAIKQCSSKGTSIGVLFIDIDNFKTINDLHGHKTGDNVLKALSMLLKDNVDHIEKVGRYGGEEFIVILQNLSADECREKAAHIIEQIRKYDTQPLGLREPITCSLGAIWTDKPIVDSAEELFAASDILMYKAKGNGKDRYCFEILHEDHQTMHALNKSLPESYDPNHPSTSEQNKSVKTSIEDLIQIAERLNENESMGFEGIRKQKRKLMVSQCELCYFASVDSELQTVQAVTKNISSGGIGLLVTRPMVRGEPVEVVLNKDTSRLYLAGLIAYCSRIDGPIHEIGIQFVSQSVQSVILGDNMNDSNKPEWVVQALETINETVRS